MFAMARHVASFATPYDHELPSETAEWISLSEHESFQAVNTQHDDPRVAQAHRRLTVEYSSRFADSATYYDEYSTSWRLLGMYIDCNVDEEQKDRRLANGGDDGDDNGLSNAWDDDQAGSGGTCKRYLLWAAVSRTSRWWSNTRLRFSIRISHDVVSFPH